MKYRATSVLLICAALLHGYHDTVVAEEKEAPKIEDASTNKYFSPKWTLDGIRFIQYFDDTYYVELSNAREDLTDYFSNKLGATADDLSDQSIPDKALHDELLASIPESIGDSYALVLLDGTSAMGVFSELALKPTGDGYSGFLGVLFGSRFTSPPPFENLAVYGIAFQTSKPVRMNLLPEVTLPPLSELEPLLKQAHPTLGEMKLHSVTGLMLAKDDSVGNGKGLAAVFTETETEQETRAENRYMYLFKRGSSGWEFVPFIEEYPPYATAHNGILYEELNAGHGGAMSNTRMLILPDVDGNQSCEILLASGHHGILYSIGRASKGNYEVRVVRHLYIGC